MVPGGAVFQHIRNSLSISRLTFHLETEMDRKFKSMRWVFTGQGRWMKVPGPAPAGTLQAFRRQGGLQASEKLVYANDH
jgi:hypothetical protein